jgi:hypothetical protein
MKKKLRPSLSPRTARIKLISPLDSQYRAMNLSNESRVLSGQAKRPMPRPRAARPRTMVSHQFFARK